jgi:hypothetical protein
MKLKSMTSFSRLSRRVLGTTTLAGTIEVAFRITGSSEHTLVIGA